MVTGKHPSLSQLNFTCTSSTFTQFCFMALMRDLWLTARWRLDAFDHWCLQHILCIPYTAHVLNLTVHKQTNQHWVTSTVLDWLLKLFGHTCRVDPSDSFAWALQASINCLPEDWQCPSSHPCQSWLRTIEGDLKTSASPQAGISHIDVPAGIVFRKQLYSGRS